MAARPTGGKYIWWPAEVQDNAKATEELLVRFVGAKRSSRVSDAVHFTARASDLDFERADVAEAFDAAVQKGAKLNPVVNLPRIHDHPVMQPVLQLRRVQGFEKRTPPEVEQVQPTRQSLEEKPEQEQLPPILKKKRDEDMCELELLRQRNIEERNAMFAKLKAELKESLSAIVPKRPPPSRRQQRPRFQGLRFLHRRDPVNTRARTRLTSGGSSSVSSNGSTPRKYYYEDEDFLDENVTYVKQERRYHPSRWLHNPNEDTLKPEDITDDMLENVADYYSQKVHCPRRGSTCHQCRQKTLDTKTVCRSGVCVGVRGECRKRKTPARRQRTIWRSCTSHQRYESQGSTRC